LFYHIFTIVVPGFSRAQIQIETIQVLENMPRVVSAEVSDCVLRFDYDLGYESGQRYTVFFDVFVAYESKGVLPSPVRRAC